jgi:ATP-dependent exoDNAse (exonuclease V) alpha subunit
LTGKAGTGKTTLIKQFIETTNKSVLVLAPTGIAALNVNGQTIHSLFKFNPKTTTTNIREVFGDNRKLIVEADTIIIDEISMVRSDLMDCIDISLKMNT